MSLFVDLFSLQWFCHHRTRLSSGQTSWSSMRECSHFLSLQICSSPFVDDEWRINLTQSFIIHLKTYALTDYRRFVSAHLLFLNKLCRLSDQSVNHFVNQFLSSLIITHHLLSKVAFDRQIDGALEQEQTTAPAMLIRLLFLLQSTSHTNAIVSTYGTNFEYLNPRLETFMNLLSGTAVTYDNNCSCGLNSNCTIPASYMPSNGNGRIELKGLKMGCTPSQSFLASTLECFYNASCIHTLLHMSNDTDSALSVLTPSALQTNASRFPVDNQVSDLLKDLFVEDWSITKNYSMYYSRCQPTQCSYTYYQQVDSLYTITRFLSLYGGLAIIFKWVCPRIIYLLMKTSPMLQEAFYIGATESAGWCRRDWSWRKPKYLVLHIKCLIWCRIMLGVRIILILYLKFLR